MAANRFFINTNTFGTITLGDSLYVQDNGTLMDTSLDHSGLAAGGLAEMYVSPEMTGSIGSATAPFKAEFNTGAGLVTNAAKSGTFYLQANSSAGANQCNKLHVVGKGTQWLVIGGTFVDVTVRSSKLFCDEAVAITNLRLTNLGYAKLLNPLEAGTLLTNCYISGNSELVSERGVSGEVHQWGGESTWDAFEETIATVYLMAGIFKLLSSGTITLFEWRGGSFDTDGAKRPIAITTLEVWPEVDPAEVAAVLGNSRIAVGTVVYR